jgi:uncharacterized protein (TIGR03435 family)
MHKCTVLLCLVLVTGVEFASAQSTKFEVASVKLSDPNPSGPFGAVPMVLPALGRLTATNVTLRILVATAYEKYPFEVVDGPAWRNSAKFDVNAKVEDASLTTANVVALLKPLLAERFNLRVHVETREVPIYELRMARNDGELGPKLKRSADRCGDVEVQRQEQLEAFAKGGTAALIAMVPKPGERKPCSVVGLPSVPGIDGQVTQFNGQSMSTLAEMLSDMTGRRVVDKTGLTGLYDFEIFIDTETTLRQLVELGVNVRTPPQQPPDAPSLTTQLRQELGLRLDSGRGPSEVLVIDSAELPTPN